MNTLRYLKWDDTVIGLVDETNAVRFTAPGHNETVRLYTRGRSAWTSGEFGAFLAGRLVSRERRDIERLLFRMGLSRYDVFAIAERTRAIHSADLLWLARAESETLASAITSVFNSVFKQRIDYEGNSVDSPEGCNVKRYGVYRGNYGFFTKTPKRQPTKRPWTFPHTRPHSAMREAIGTTCKTLPTVAGTCAASSASSTSA
jgi:hypothetical protein